MKVEIPFVCIEARKAAPTRAQIELLMQGLQQAQKPRVSHIALTTSDSLLFVSTNDIIYCQAESNYTMAVLTAGKKIVVSKVLKDIDEALAGPDFYRIHNSYLVNINHIQKFVRGDGGYVIMDDGENISISRSHR
jgi:two-component system LytT family response regulator